MCVVVDCVCGCRVGGVSVSVGAYHAPALAGIWLAWWPCVCLYMRDGVKSVRTLICVGLVGECWCECVCMFGWAYIGIPCQSVRNYYLVFFLFSFILHVLTLLGHIFYFLLIILCCDGSFEGVMMTYYADVLIVV